MSWMKPCGGLTTQHVPRGYGYKEVKSTCGQTSYHGGMVLCEKCEAKANTLYPQGWRNMPGDICEHGTYIGTPGGADYICGACESKDWLEEQAMEAGMLHGIDAYNDVKGHSVTDMNDPRNMPSPNEMDDNYWEDE